MFITQLNSSVSQDSKLTAPNTSNQTLRVLAWPKHSANPYTQLLYTGMEPRATVDEFSAAALRHRYAVWHVHWPESLLNIRNRQKAAFKLNVFLAAVNLIKWRGGKIIWTMHNFKAHDDLHPDLEARFWRRWIPLVDGAISLSETGLATGLETCPRLRDLPTAVIPHGHYRDQYPRAEVQDRESMGAASASRSILFFGAIRQYKNVDGLVRAFRSISDPQAKLWVVGRPSSAALSDAIQREASGDSRIRLVFEFVKDEDVAKYMQAADLVVLPYRSILNSGSALLALSFDRPVLVPNLGSMGDLRNDFGEKWVRTFDGELGPEALNSALKWASVGRLPICPMPPKYYWPSIREETARFYERVVSNGDVSHGAKL